MSETRHTLPLAELRRGHSASFGGKSSALGELIAAGIPVPPGFAVSTSAFRAFVEEAGLGGMIAAEMSRMSPGDVDSVGAASHAISQAMRFAPVPDAVRDEVAQRYAELGRRPASRSRRSPSAPARSARTARTRRSRASRRRTSGCAAPTTSATPCATAG